MTDDGFSLVLILAEELLRAGECNLVDILVHLLCCHSYSVILNSEGLFVLVDNDTHTHIAQITFGFAYGSKCLEFLSGIHSIADKLTQKNLVV